MTLRCCILLANLILSSHTFACFCMKLGDNFFDTINQHNIKVKNNEFPITDKLTIFTGKVIKYQTMPEQGVIPPSMQVKVEHILQGDIAAKKIWIYGDEEGIQCRPPIINFHLNTHYIFAVNHDEDGTYFISICGYYYLQTTSPEEN